MSRNETLAAYTIENGIIVDSGKFEGEPIYTPEFYDACLDGCGEDLEGDSPDGSFAILMEIEPADRIEYPELGEAKYVFICCDSQGFISTNLVEDESEANSIRASFDPEENEACQTAD